ncbi:acetylglutamate kinase [Clostridium guangxiense]|uniref:acetylglutamate kinase n=1 Tax=Clostridium guangxiense TaxID=1662055 RepID=UPI001E3C2F9D|nr:acetylglutamate kinase [Clostridium guangxiense]
MKNVENELEDPLGKLEEFKGKTFVIKYGGSIMKNENSEKAFIEDVKILRNMGINLVIVHGGGPEISKWLQISGVKSEFVEGLRVTDERVMEVVQMVLSGKINKDLSLKLNMNDVKSVGLSGVDNKIIQAQKKYIYKDGKKIDIGYVGEVVNINETFILNLIKNGQVPVISPIGCDDEGNIYNINADYAASFISSALNAEKLIVLTDVEGVYKDINDKDSLIKNLPIDDIQYYIEEGVISGGMIPKMQCCMNAILGGTKNVHLIDGRNKHCIINDIVNYKGTVICGKEEVECQKVI